MPNFLVEVYLLFFWGGDTLHMVRLVVSLIGREAVNGYVFVQPRFHAKFALAAQLFQATIGHHFRARILNASIVLDERMVANTQYTRVGIQL